MDDNRRGIVDGEHITIWAVCEDEWEANGPVAVFATEELANEHCTALNAECGKHDVRAFPLLSEVPHKVTWYHRQAGFRRDGTVEQHEQKPRVGWDYGYESDPAILVCEPRYGVTVNAYATSAEAANAACRAATEIELAKRSWSPAEGWSRASA